MLLLLEGELVRFPAPKTHFSQDLILNSDTPIFATSKTPLVLIKGGFIDERETEMMNVRWKYISFQYQIPVGQQQDIVPCPKCFASLVFEHDGRND